MIKQVLAFGDSNTWGQIPGTHDRYPWGVRWTSVLQEKERCNNVRIIEEGLCGRTILFDDELRPGRKGIDMLPFLLETHSPLDAAIVMLGTNDCKAVYQASAYVIGKGVELCLNELTKAIPAKSILLISPILLGDDVWKPEKDPEFNNTSILTCKMLKDEYKRIATEKGTSFLSGSDFAAASKIDDEHLTKNGHFALADAIYRKLIEIGVL